MSENSSILVSVIIPVKNGDAWLDDVLPAILKQKVAGNTEIIIIDSGSTDDTLLILKKYPVQLVSIPANEFNHGSTRNLGVQMAKGEYVVMTVQDARPSNEFWLQNLLDGFTDESVAGVCGQQIVPHERNKNPVYWFRPVDAPSMVKYNFTPQAFEALSPREKKTVCGWDNVNAMYRKRVLQQIPFRNVPFAEDAWWAKDAILQGFSLVYNGAAQVYHYHHEEKKYTFERSFTQFYHNYKLFKFVPGYTANELREVLSNAKLLFLEKGLTWKEKLGWLRHNYQLRKNLRAAINAFNDALKGGEENLDRVYSQIAKKPPQAVKQTGKDKFAWQ